MYCASEGAESKVTERLGFGVLGLEFRVWGLGFGDFCRPLINKPLPIVGIIIGILVFRPNGSR